MTNDEQTPGTFSDGRTPPEDDFIEEQIAFAATKEDLIDNLLKTKSITPQYAFLLQSIQTATLGREGAILRKVQAVLALREALRQESIAKRLTLNIGSDIDWQFPVALGARDIVLMDPGFKEAERLQKLLESVRLFDKTANFQGDDPTSLPFHLDLGEGVELVNLHVSKDRVTKYQSAKPIGCVIEFAGPSKGFNRSGVPVTTNIAQIMADDGLILNFDYSHDFQYLPEIGIDFVKLEGFYFYKVYAKDMMITASKIKHSPPEPSLAKLRAILKARR